MSRAPSAARLVGAVLVVGSAIAGAVVACSAPPDTARGTEVFPPDYNAFKGPVGPSAFLERRCGTLDCHGQIGRPLRIFGQRGLRLVDEAGLIPGAVPTTDAEQRANFQAVISLEPETMSIVVAEGVGPERLLLIKKPRLQEGHKGGQITIAGDDGDRCLTSWVIGQTDTDACTKAATAFNR